MKSGKNSVNQIKYGSLISYLLIGINILLGLVYTPWVLREVGDSNYGVYTIASSIIALFLMDFGMSAAVTRFISKYRAENNQERIDSFAGVAIKFYLIICAIVAIILVGLYANIDRIYANLTPREVEGLKTAFIITGFFVVVCFPVNVCNGILNAYEQYVYLKGADILNKVGTVIVTIIFLSLHYGIFALIFINGLFNLITFVFKSFLLFRFTPVRPKIRGRHNLEFKNIISFSAWTTVRSLAQQMIYNIMPSVLAMVTTTHDITMFGFASVIEGYVYTITQAINGLFLPKISRIVVGEKNAKKTLPLMIKVGRLNQSVITLLIIGLILVGDEFTRLWVGDSFKDLGVCIVLLAVPYYIAASQQIANSSLIALNRVKEPAIIQLATGALNLVLSYFVAGGFGVVGVCSVICATFIIRIIALNITYVKVLEIDIKSFFLECHLKLLPATLICGLLAGVMTYFIPSGIGFYGWALLGTKVLTISLVYVAVMWLIGWNSYEKGLIKSFIPKSIKSKK